jgi:hypothetical protein
MLSPTNKFAKFRRVILKITKTDAKKIKTNVKILIS